MKHGKSNAPKRHGLARWALICMPLVLMLGLASGAVSGSSGEDPWFASLAKPGFYPPPLAFPIAWTILYLMMGLALAIICAAHGRVRGRGAAIAAFAVQLALNLAWSPVFFGAQMIGAALGVLLALDVAALITFVLFWRVRPGAALLLLPYLAWLAFATLLNAQILALNPGA